MENPLSNAAIKLTKGHLDPDLFWNAKNLVCQISFCAHWLVLPLLSIADEFFTHGDRLQAIELVSFVCRNAHKTSPQYIQSYQQAAERLECYLNNVDISVGLRLGWDGESIKTELEKSYQKFRDQIFLHTGTIALVEEAAVFMERFPLRLSTT